MRHFKIILRYIILIEIILGLLISLFDLNKNEKFNKQCENTISTIVDKYYNLEDEIIIYFSIPESIKIKEYNFEIEGLLKISSSYKKGQIEAKFKYLNGEFINLALYASDDEKKEHYSEIFGYIYNNYIYLSQYSYGNAKEICYEHLTELGLLKRDEAIDLVNKDIINDITIIRNNVKKIANFNNTELNCQLLWEDDYGIINPLAYTMFDVTEYIGNYVNCNTYYTDENGFMPSGIIVNDSSLIELRIYAAGDNTCVNSSGIISSIWALSMEYDINISEIIISTSGITDYGRAQEISQALIYAEKYSNYIAGRQLNYVNSYYPSNSTYYLDVLHNIYISGISSDYDYKDWDVIMHEYGHHFTSEMGISSSLSLSHSSSENLSERYGKNRGIQLAWQESIPTFFGELAQQYFRDAVGSLANVADGKYTDTFKNTSGEDSTNSYLYNKTFLNGESCERTILSVLWDMIDDDSYYEHFDLICIDDFDLWSVIIESEAVTFSQFICYYYYISQDIDLINEIGILLENIKLSVYDIEFISDTLNYQAPMITWKISAAHSIDENYIYGIIIYDNESNIIGTYQTNNNFYSLTNEQWSAILNLDCEFLYAVVFRVNNDSPSTGPYGSRAITILKPQLIVEELDMSVSVIGIYYETTSICIPGEINNKKISIIAINSFKNSSISSIAIPSSVTSIGASAFEGCNNLETVIIEGNSNVVSLGANAFRYHNPSLKIYVDKDLVGEYKNTPYWTVYQDLIQFDEDDYEVLNLNCSSNENINLNTNEVYKLNVECNNLYTFNLPSNTHIDLYDSNFIKLDTIIDSENIDFTNNTYYIKLVSDDYNIESLNIISSGFYTHGSVNYNITNHIHNNQVKLRYVNTNVSGFYKISSLGLISIYSNIERSNLIKKYNLLTVDAYQETSMYVYLENNQTYYINIDLNYDYNNVYFIVSNAVNIDINLFNIQNNNSSYIPVLDGDIKVDYIQKLTLHQRACLEYIINSDNDILCILIDANNNEVLFPFNNYTNTNTFNLSEGTYYIGYLNNTNLDNIEIFLRRIITQSGSNYLITDPGSVWGCGSEVLFNNGNFLGNTITVGFTRFIYLNNDLLLESYSRLDYDFYSSNDNIASVSIYGTILAKSSGSVGIMAVYKQDPSKVFLKQFNVVEDNNTNINIITTYITYERLNNIEYYSIELNDLNSPYPMNTLYNWTIIESTEDNNYNISDYGTILLYSTDTIIIEGVYQLNSNVKVRIILTVT